MAIRTNGLFLIIWFAGYHGDVVVLFSKCHYRKYTISEIINSIIGSGFTLERFDEHPSWENEKLPGEFTAIARKR